jgi:hypothetical protein
MARLAFGSVDGCMSASIADRPATLATCPTPAAANGSTANAARNVQGISRSLASLDELARVSLDPCALPYRLELVMQVAANPTFPQGPYCPPPAPIAAGLLDAAGKLVNEAKDKLAYSLQTTFTPKDAMQGAQLLLNGVDMLSMAFPQASSMTGRFASNAQQVVANPTTANTTLLLADAKAAVELVNALRPHAV